MINVTPSQKTTQIYLITNCYNDPNKVYIGKTKNSTRENDHRKTYGQEIIFTYIDEVNSLEYKDWEILESFWIEYFKFLGFDLQNKRKKGGSGPNFHTEETKNKIRNFHKGRKRSEDTKEKMRKPKSESHRLNMCHPKPGNRKKKPEGFNIGRIQTEETKEKISIKLKGRNIPQEWIDKSSKKKKKPIIQYDLNGNIIREWPSALDVFNELKISRTTISNVCKKHPKYKTAGGFIWEFKQ